MNIPPNTGAHAKSAESESLNGFDSLPPDIIRAIRGFPKPHEPFFRIAQTVPRWRDLVQTDPVLALIVAAIREVGGLPITKILEAGKESMCAAAGFPSNEKTVRLLPRFVICQKTAIRDLRLLRELLRWEPLAFEILELCPAITESELNHLAIGKTTFENWGNLDLLEWFFRLPAAMRHFVGESYSIAPERRTTIALLGEVKALDQFCSAQEAISYLQDYASTQDRIISVLERICEGTQAFPCPATPLPPSGRIVPFHTLKEVLDATYKLGAHIDLWEEDTFLGDHCFYRVEWEKPCTLGLIYEDETWQIAGLVGDDQEEILDEGLVSEVKTWLESSRSPERDAAAHRESRKNYLRHVAALSGLTL